MERFHAKAQGCRIVRRFSEIFCRTHSVSVCHCGWEFGWHYGQDAGGLQPTFTVFKRRGEIYVSGRLRFEIERAERVRKLRDELRRLREEKLDTLRGSTV